MIPPQSQPDPSVRDRTDPTFAPHRPRPRGEGPAGHRHPEAPDPAGRLGGAEGFAVHGRLLQEGPDRLSTAELLAVVLGSAGPHRDAGADAWAVLSALETVRRISCATAGQLSLEAGISAEAAARLAAAFELGRRAGDERLPRGAPFTSSQDIFDRYYPLLRDARRERFLCVMLDAKNRVMRDEAISTGSLTSSLVHPREVFSAAIRESAGGLVFIHNHPSGDPEPSPEDIEITRRLCSAGEIVGIRVLDHVVVGDGAYVSMLDRGWIAEWT